MPRRHTETSASSRVAKRPLQRLTNTSAVWRQGLTAGMASVWMKSSPLKRIGSPVERASA